MLVPPRDTLLGKPVFMKLLNTIGNPATTAINTEPIKVILPITVLIYCFVSLPGLTPGIYPPLLFKFLDNSSGFICKNV